MSRTMEISGIDCLGLDRVLKRGSGEKIAQQNGALLIRDTISGAFMLACNDSKVGISLLDRFIGQDCNLLMVSDHTVGITAFEKYGFSEKLECYQVAYYGKMPAIESDLSIKTADRSDLPILLENYHLINPEELEKVVLRGSVLLGYFHGRLVGFVGEHLEGSMGLLYVFPEYRRKGFGEALQKHMIARTMRQGFIPFGQVEKDNLQSLELQKKIGMTISDNQIIWMWK